MKHRLTPYRCEQACRQSGFTLIELMVSMVLGLLITAAVFQVYFISTKTATTQAAGSELVETAAFNIPIMERSIRLTNLGMADEITGIEPGAGIILTSENNAIEMPSGTKHLDNLKNPDDLDAKTSSPKNITLNGGVVSVGLLSHSGEDESAEDTGTNEWTGASNVNTASGQLTIQYRAPQDMFDCEGNKALGPRTVDIGGVDNTIDGQVIIERYYLNASGTDDTQLSLYCDAGKYITEKMDDYADQGDSSVDVTVFTTNNSIRDFGDKGVELLQNVDYFDVLLVMQDSSGTGDAETRFYTVGDYLSLDVDEQQPIIALKIGMILRSQNTVLASTGTSFEVLGNSLSLNEDLDDTFMRTAYDTTVSLRNVNMN